MDDYIPRRLSPAAAKDRTMAETFYDRLQEHINHELARLDEGEQLAANQKRSFREHAWHCQSAPKRQCRSC
jgi:hypothetical protein